MQLKQGWGHILISGFVIAMILAGCGSQVDPITNLEAATPNLTPTSVNTSPNASAATAQATPTGADPDEPTADEASGERNRDLISASQAITTEETIDLDSLRRAPALPTPTDLGLLNLFVQAQNDLAQTRAIDKEEIELIALEPVVWPDGSLGCPQPGIAYPQVQVEGFRIQLRIKNQIFTYHQGRGKEPFLCKINDQLQTLASPETQEDAMTPGNPAPQPNNPATAALVDVARKDLAQRLTIAEVQIQLLSVEFVTWPDGSLGCPQPDVAYTQILIDGTRIRLQVDQRVYHYHSGGNRPPFLCENPARPGPSNAAPAPGFSD